MLHSAVPSTAHPLKTVISENKYSIEVLTMKPRFLEDDLFVIVTIIVNIIVNIIKRTNNQLATSDADGEAASVAGADVVRVTLDNDVSVRVSTSIRDSLLRADQAENQQTSILLRSDDVLLAHVDQTSAVAEAATGLQVVHDVVDVTGVNDQVASELGNAGSIVSEKISDVTRGEVISTILTIVLILGNNVGIG
uniref:Uncharacterized protein n=1 Tax=viral metagenome TaxID=1070528 RepID=A0A6C0HKB9_9ZZZZ